MTHPAPITPDTVNHDKATALSGHCEGLSEAMTTLSRMCAEAPVGQTNAAFAGSVIHELRNRQNEKQAQIARIYSREGQGDG